MMKIKIQNEKIPKIGCLEHSITVGIIFRTFFQRLSDVHKYVHSNPNHKSVAFRIIKY